MGISNATRVWLGDLLAAGWTAEVVERRPSTQRYRLRLADDLEDVVRERVVPAAVWVVATSGESSVVIGCASVGEARGLLEAAAAEAA